MKIAFLYAGQGSQFVGMGKDFYDTYPLYQETIDTLDSIHPVKSVSFNGPMELLTKTSQTQPSMVAFAIGVTKLLKERNIEPEMVAGLSLGEYSALYAASVFSEEDVIKIISFRGKVMEDTVKGMDTKMSAVLGLTFDEVQEILKMVTNGIVEVANSNCPGQIVIGGETIAVELAENLAREHGAKRIIPLSVSGPFHTSCMKAAGDALEEYFQTINFDEMEYPVIFNLLGSEKSNAHSIAEILAKQVSHTVLFEKSIRTMLDAGIDTFIEIGPGKVLSSFVKKIDRSVKILPIDTVDRFEKVIAEITQVEV